MGERRFPPDPAGATKGSVAICYGDQLLWTPDLAASNSSFVNASGLVKMFYLNKPFLSETPLKAPRWPVSLAELEAWLGVDGRKETGLRSGAALAHLLAKRDVWHRRHTSTSASDLRNLWWPGSRGSLCTKVTFLSRTWSPGMVGIERCSLLLGSIWILPWHCYPSTKYPNTCRNVQHLNDIILLMQR